ncbi:phosphate ABC transporter permease PstA [Acidithiobacillus thiooxidans]|uniref:phosphate ABC transporter permease PstA n=2 Tax=Acidithiobacillus thiooxidans TaxID=930 RepID=UPI001C078B5B|nr:phosphate ABC transporter permease PstA [Acidithiobacillus thiooxidans]MBU2840365.1 phosphate ABC transporter permease PstA [Acidithiobacillus thiooxidans]MBU2843134.1 phosphate ABC transporter permease PstA [Acidithiobacillus thiooxidans]
MAINVLEEQVLPKMSTPRKFKVSLWRRLMTVFATVMVTGSFVFLAAMFLSIIVDVLIHAWPALNIKLLTEITNGIGGGLKNAIEGSIIMSVGSLLLAAPIGISAGIYLSEHGHGNAGKLLRFLSDVLVGIPSIVLGYVGYITMVIYLGWQFSVAAGIITLTVMLLPYIARSTELALSNIPLSVREAGYGLGAGEGRIVFKILLPGAAPAIMTGLFYAVALSMGETAPLLYTAGWSNYMWTGKLTNEPIGYLTYVIWTFINEPFAESHMLAFAAAFLITAGVLMLILAGRWYMVRAQRRMGAYR